MKGALILMAAFVWWAFLLGSWLRLVWFFFHMWAPL